MSMNSKTGLLYNLANRKINSLILYILLVVCAGFSGFYSMRGTLLVFGFGMSVLTNDVAAFIISCLFNSVTIFFIVNVIFSLFSKHFGAKKETIKYCLFAFLIPAFLLSGLIKILYFFYPFIFVYGEIFIDFVFQLIFISFFTVFCCKYFFYKQDYHKITFTIFGLFLLVSVISILLSLITGGL